MFELKLKGGKKETCRMESLSIKSHIYSYWIGTCVSLTNSVKFKFSVKKLIKTQGINFLRNSIFSNDAN